MEIDPRPEPQEGLQDLPTDMIAVARKGQKTLTRRKKSAKAVSPKLGGDGENPEFPVETLASLVRGDSANHITGVGGLKHLVPRGVAKRAAASEMAFEDPKESLTELLLALQSGDTSVRG